jgi:hypothetical protein
MTFDDPGWSLFDRGGRLETLGRDECRRLLGSTNVAVSDTALTSGRASCR